MKRRQFLTASAVGLVGGVASQWASAKVCPPPSFNVGRLPSINPCTTGIAPAWALAMADRTWTTVAAVGTIAQVTPTPAPSGSALAIISAWCTACVDTSRQELVIPAQGGHNDYHGNEVYTLAFNVASPAWSRVSNPRYAFGANGWEMDDGSPRAVHGYSSVAYAASSDRTYLAPLSATVPFGNSYHVIYAFDRNTNTWARKNNFPSNWSTEMTFGGIVYDKLTGMMWVAGTNGTTNSVTKYDPVNDSHTVYTNTPLNRGYSGTLAIAPTRGILIYMNGSTVGQDGSFAWLDTNNPAAGWHTPAAVSGSGLTGAGPGFVWHEPSGKFIGWNGVGTRSTLSTLTPPSNPLTGTWTWSTVPADPANTVVPSTAVSNGTYGRFNLIENLGGAGRDYLVLVNSINEPTYIYKLPGNGI